MTTGGYSKYGSWRPATLPYVDMSRSEATRTPTILPMNPTLKSAKRIICRTRFEAPVYFAFFGMNNAASALCVRPESPVLPDGAFIIASLGRRAVRLVPRTAFCYIPSAMTGFTACVFRFPNRVSLKEAFEVLEPDEGKPIMSGS